MPDLMNYVMQRACRLFGGPNDGVFNAACFSAAMQKTTGVKRVMDGYTVDAILHGRDDVETLAGGAHYQMERL